MPNILVLVDKKTGKRHEGRGHIEIDELLCKALGEPVDPVDFLGGWVDWMALYLNDTLDEVIASYKETDTPERWALREPILNWLNEHYALNTYAIIGKR